MTRMWLPELTADGSATFFSAEFGETFHSRTGAQREALEKFAIATALATKSHRSHLTLLDICYGLGYNTAAALALIWQQHPQCHVTVVGLEIDATIPVAALEILPPWPESVLEVLRALAHQHYYTSSNCQAQLHLGDARQTIQTLVASGFQADAIFLDPFSPQRCPQLWTVEFLGMVARCLAVDGYLATYSRAAAVRSGLLAAGLQIGTLPLPTTPQAPHEWSQGTIARWQATGLVPLSGMEQEHLQTRAGIPYRDPTLTDTAEQIRARRRAEQQTSTREPTTQWRRRWRID